MRGVWCWRERETEPLGRDPGIIVIACETCCGVPMAAMSLEAAVHLALVPRHEGIAIHFCNAYTLSLAHRDARYLRLLRSAWLCLPDGQSVVWARHLLGKSSKLRKISGPDFFRAAFAASDQSGPKHYLLGGTPHTLAILVATLSNEFPTARIVGHQSPPFRKMSKLELQAQDDAIRDSCADIVWVGLGTPKQDYEVSRLAATLPVTAVAVGAAFDFAAGTKKRAPRWMQSVGLEWLYRFGQEPHRLWRRYLIGNVIFLWSVWRNRNN